MRITKVKLDNYVCFYDAPEFELRPGINFVVGKNNSGKTALLDVLSHLGKGEPHSSVETINPSIPSSVGTETQYEIAYEFRSKELLRLLLDSNDYAFFPLPPKKAHIGIELQRLTMPSGFMNGDPDKLKYFFRANRAERVKLDRFEHHFLVGGDSRLDCYRAEDSRLGRPALKDMSLEYEYPQQEYSKLPKETSWAQVANEIPRSVFRFLAERRIPAVSPVEEGDKLKSDASNLASVLIGLDYNREEYLNLVQQVLPEICYYRCVPGKGTVELRLSYNPQSSGRNDLAVSLNDCGTGVGQILAMLYVVLTYGKSDPRVIVIDEPNSFLHPGAVRNLLRIFQEHGHHQYIIATHSPTAIMSVKEKNILHVKRNDKRHKSTVKNVGVNSNEELEAMLESIGTRRSDIFGMDKVIWVEGKTDATCFKLIMDKAGGLSFGTNIMALVNTGDFERGRDATLAVEIYRTLSGGVGLLPSALGFVFDGDKESEHSNIHVSMRPLIRYLPRKDYESYLIAPSILADILRRDGAGGMKEHSEESLAKWIRENNNGRDYDDPDWLREVDGAKFLDKLFNCKGGISYNDKKVAYGVEITKRILERDESAAHFQEIVDILKPLLDPDQSEDKPART